MEPRAAADYVLSLAKENRCKDVDVLLGRNESLSVRILRGQVEKIDQSTSLGLGVRVVHEGRTGLAFTERMETQAIERAFRAARENADLQDPTEVMLPESPPQVPDPEALGLYNPELEAITVGDLSDFGLEAEAAATGADSRASVVQMGVSKSQSTFRIVSTHGVEYEQRQSSVGAYCGVLLEHNGDRKSGGQSWSRRAWDPEAADALGKEATRRGVELLGAKPIPQGTMPIVLDEYCAPQLLSMFFGAFSAEAAQKGQSRLKGRLDEEIAVPELTLMDDPHQHGGPASRYLDGEGTPTAPLPLIEQGVFRNFLYHIESARKEGRASTGHASRSYSGGVGTRSHNLTVPGGDLDTLALAGVPERCLLVTELEGGAGCNGLSGDISIGVQGFLMEGGKSVQPVDTVTIAGNFFDVLKNIRGFGGTYQPNLSSLHIPALLIDGLAVSS